MAGPLFTETEFPAASLIKNPIQRVSRKSEAQKLAAKPDTVLNSLTDKEPGTGTGAIRLSVKELRSDPDSLQLALSCRDDAACVKTSDEAQGFTADHIAPIA